jgi:NTE family protein
MTTHHAAVWQQLRTRGAPYLLALQGGGTFGAFQAGVLCKLLADPTFPLPTAISGTSAGALNAVILADALLAGGTEAEQRQRAIRALTTLWQERIPKMALEYLNKYFPDLWLFRTPLTLPSATMLDLMQQALDMWLDTMNAYGMPVRIPLISEADNTLRMLVDGVNFERLRRNTRIKLYIAACEAAAPHKGRVFTTTEITDKVVAASGALPDMFAPIVIDGVAYMEGGYAHNPPLMDPIADGADTVILIRLNSDRFTPPRFKSEQIYYDQAEMFNKPLKRDQAAIKALNKGRKTPAVTAFDIGGLGRSGFTPPQKRRVSHTLIRQLFSAGEQAGLSALSHAPDGF